MTEWSMSPRIERPPAHRSLAGLVTGSDPCDGMLPCRRAALGAHMVHRHIINEGHGAPPPCTGKMGHRAELLPAVRLTTPTTPHPVRMSRYGINKQWFWIPPWPREAEHKFDSQSCSRQYRLFVTPRLSGFPHAVQKLPGRPPTCLRLVD